LLGLFAFFYVCLHLSVWLVLDHFFDWAELGKDILKRPYITVGMLAWTLLLPLAATSTTGMIKRLGGANWRRLHRLAYVAAVLACLHFIWLAKKVRVDPWVYAAILAVLLGVRAWDVARRFAGRRRSSSAGGVRRDESPDATRWAGSAPQSPAPTTASAHGPSHVVRRGGPPPPG
jgi:sulfoxide reductase heme-binding subunit YedZ